MADPVFDPSKPFEPVEQPRATPTFDPSKPYEEVKPPTWGETAADVAKQVAVAPVRAVEAAATWPAQLLEAVGPTLGKPFEWMGMTSPEAEEERQQRLEAIRKQAGPPGIGKYLPEAKTRPGKYLGTAAEFATGAALSPGRLAVTAPIAAGAGLTSEAAGQAMETAGPLAEGVARFLGAAAGMGAGLGIHGIGRAWLSQKGNVEVAQQRLMRAFERDGVTPDDVLWQLQRVKQVRPDATLMDVAGPEVRNVLEMIAQSPGGRGVVEPVLTARQRGQASRLVNDLTGATGTRQSAFQALEQATEARKTAARPLYQQAYADGDRAIWSDELERLSSSSAVKQAMQSAVRNWRDQAIADGYGAMNPGALAERGGQLRFLAGKVPVFPNLQFWDYVKNSLDQAYKRSVRESGPTKESARLATFLSQLRGELDREVPTYAAARGQWAGQSAYIDAINEGKSILNKNITAEELSAAWQGMSQGEREGYRIGAVSSIINQIRSNPAKAPDFTRVMRSPEMRDKLSLLMPSGEAMARFNRALDYEVRSSEIVGQSLGNSATFRRLAAAQDAENLIGELVTTAMHGVPGFWTGMRQGAQYINRRLRTHSDRELAKLLTSGDPVITAEAVRRGLVRPENIRGAIQSGAIGLGASENAQPQRTREGYPFYQARQAGGGVPAIGAAGGRSPGTTTPARARAARQRTSQALQDGGAARDQAGPTIKPGTREHWAALIASPVHGGPTTSGAPRGKAPTGVSYNDIVDYLKRRGIPSEGMGSFSEYAAEARQEGGSVEGEDEDEKLPLPGQSIGLGKVPVITNRAGETLPEYIAKAWGRGAADWAMTPGRAYKEGLTPEEETDWAARTAGQLTGRGVTQPAPGIGIFGGIGAKTANTAMLDKALRMHAAGSDPTSIWNQTGWFRGAEGKWRFEIPDVEARLKELDPEYLQRLHASGSTGPTHRFSPDLREVVEHPEFFRAYPEMKAVVGEVVVDPHAQSSQFGFWQPPHQTLTGIEPPYIHATGRDVDLALSSTLHEMQHGVQNVERFAPGSSRELAAKVLGPTASERAAADLAATKGLTYSDLHPLEKRQFRNQAAAMAYLAHAGETEARNVQRRWERGISRAPPWRTEDVAREKQIIPTGQKRKRFIRGEPVKLEMQQGGSVEDEKPEEPSLPKGLAEAWGDPFERAAYRQARAVRPRSFTEEGRTEGMATRALEKAGESVIPQSPSDYALMALGGPWGRAAKVGAVGLAALLESLSPAEAGKIKTLMELGIEPAYIRRILTQTKEKGGGSFSMTGGPAPTEGRMMGVL